MRVRLPLHIHCNCAPSFDFMAVDKRGGLVRRSRWRRKLAVSRKSACHHHCHGLLSGYTNRSFFFLLSYNINFVFMFVGLAASARRHWLRILWRRFGRSSSDTAASIATSLPQSFIHCWIHIDGWLVRQPCPRRTSQTRQQSGRRDWRNCKWRCSTFGTRHSGPLGPVPEEYRWANGTCFSLRGGGAEKRKENCNTMRCCARAASALP